MLFFFLHHFVLFYAFSYDTLMHNFALYIHVSSNFLSAIIPKHLVLSNTLSQIPCINKTFLRWLLITNIYIFIALALAFSLQFISR